mmetsp:Transcript_67839/g.150257  ORF Transcript_67839/g.150257 Transcript_67839/m.150257 type:complete len:286 (+) Transcript_67839:506-1363(+)
MISDPCSRNLRRILSALFTSFSLSLLISAATKRSTYLRSVRTAFSLPLEFDTHRISTPSFVARFHVATMLRWSFFLAASRLGRSFPCAPPSCAPSADLSLDPSSPGSPCSSEASSPEPSPSSELCSRPAALAAASASLAAASSSGASSSSATASLGSGSMRRSFISWSNWKRSGSPPLSGCNSKAFFLKARRMAPWSRVCGMPNTAQAARFSSVFMRPFAFFRHSWRKPISSLMASSLMPFKRSPKRRSPACNSSMRRWGSTAPNLTSKPSWSMTPLDDFSGCSL